MKESSKLILCISAVAVCVICIMLDITRFRISDEYVMSQAAVNTTSTVAANYTDSLEIGQIWVYSFCTNKNPFKHQDFDTMRIIDIQSDYVQYYSSYLNDTTSIKISIFVHGSELMLN